MYLEKYQKSQCKGNKADKQRFYVMFQNIFIFISGKIYKMIVTHTTKITK